MTPTQLIKKRLSVLKEKELSEGLSKDEQIEIGKLYIAHEINDIYEKKVDEMELILLRKEVEIYQKLSLCEFKDRPPLLKELAGIMENKIKLNL